ncbi:MAG: selenide, water dikinase SelD [Chloroflexi bacterium]|nr:selenide, water dikinase SelD [Chloroflexota bacterium]
MTEEFFLSTTNAPIKLTSMATCAGCAAKLSASKLAELLAPLQDVFDGMDVPDLLVGLGAPDDAAVWRLDDTRALVVTTDFFTPVVDNPYDFGAIAAANALSDVYAMGATPFLGLNVLGLPNDLPLEIGQQILRGGAEKAKEAGVVVAGGHTIQDPEPKYGLIALGMLDIEHAISKSGARSGDVLFLTKPLGFGVTNTAVKRGKANAEDEAEVVKWMSMLNRDAAELAKEFSVRGGTDVTGFGLMGHAWEMTKGADLQFKIEFAALPFTSGARRFGEAFTFPGGSLDNRTYYSRHVSFREGLLDWEKMLLFDAQTSGGLLLAVPEKNAQDFAAEAGRKSVPIWEIGSATGGKAGIEVF